MNGYDMTVLVGALMYLAGVALYVRIARKREEQGS